MRVEVCFSPTPGVVDRCELELPEGATLAQAVQASGLVARHPSLAVSPLDAGVWGRRQPPDTVLQAHDRVELYRPLTVDPMEARRRRDKVQAEVGRGVSGSRRRPRRGRAAPRRRAGRRRALRARPCR